MVISVGVVYGWDSDSVLVSLTRKPYRPSLGDILYVREKLEDGTLRTILMEVVEFKGGFPIHVSVPEEQGVPEYYKLEREVFARAKLFIEIVEVGNNKYISKASRPPSLLSQAYLLRAGDLESDGIMKDITERAGQQGIPVAVLRSGVAHSEREARERHFKNAYFKLDLHRLIPKHVLISGQTGSGKTSGLMGLLVMYAMNSTRPIGWVIVDRHGEYTPSRGYEPDSFIGVLVDSIELNENLRNSVRVRTYRLAYDLRREEYATKEPTFSIVRAPIKASSITFTDFAMMEGVEHEHVVKLEEFVMVVAPALERLAQGTIPGAGKASSTKLIAEREYPRQVILPEELFMQCKLPECATGNMLALIVLLADNMVRYEGVGLRREEKTGMHRVLVDRGVDALATRILRRLILSKMGWKVRPEVEGGRLVYVIDDSRSVAKVPEVLKNPRKLACMLEVLWRSLVDIYREAKGEAPYPWRGICRDEVLEVVDADGIDISEIVKYADEGRAVVIDVSGVDSTQGDLVSVTVSRRLFEHRLELGVEESGRRPSVGIVSEEAPLYLSPEKVRSPFNPFARIAREGRKFGVGLIAITQLATLIERQVLANFNTLVILRTRSRSDLDYFGDLGIPVETLPFLGDREGFIYTPDLPIKEPVPVYLPGWFEYRELLEAKKKAVEERHRIDEKLAKALGLGADSADPRGLPE